MVIMFYMIFGMQVPHLKIMYHVHHDPPIYDLDLKVELFSVGTITKYTYKFIFKIVLHEGHKYEYIR